MSDLLSEDRLTLTELAQQEGVSVCTPWRWAKRGARGAVLETFNIGAHRYTTRQAFERFTARCSATVQGVTAPAPRTNRQRDAAIRKAEAELAKAGV